ncbi:contactin-1a-like [Branchiostoma lanceolatum]|uniref:contactin-1a-like n=1 Tax=Branchiostoma lanceolatum TaxID=7740 RepID=UPI003456F15C
MAFLLVFLFTICTVVFQGARGQLTFDMAPPVQWAAVGTDYTLQCLASIPGDYAVNVYFKEGLLIDTEVDRYRIVEEGLTILDVGRGDGGNYTCASQGAIDFTIQGQTFIQLIVTGPPSAPEVLRFSSVGTDSLDVEVSAPEDDGGSPITDYVIQIRQSEQEVEWREFVSQTAGPVEITGLLAATTYELRVAAVNADNGQGPFSALETITTLDDVTRAPLESSTVVNASAMVPTADTYNTPPPPDSPMPVVWIVVPTLVAVTLAVTGLVAFGVHKNVIHVRPGHKVTDIERSA